MIRTRVGYTGGTSFAPTYMQLGDHTEAIEVVYDPREISYGELVDVFFVAHRPTYDAIDVQYRSAVFVVDAAEREVVEQKLAARSEVLGKRLYTAVEEARTFYVAEDYHQKYRLRGDTELMKVFSELYPSDGDFHASTAAARANGILGGYGSSTQLESLGLPDVAEVRLRERLRR